MGTHLDSCQSVNTCHQYTLNSSQHSPDSWNSAQSMQYNFLRQPEQYYSALTHWNNWGSFLVPSPGRCNMRSCRADTNLCQSMKTRGNSWRNDLCWVRAVNYFCRKRDTRLLGILDSIGRMVSTFLPPYSIPSCSFSNFVDWLESDTSNNPQSIRDKGHCQNREQSISDTPLNNFLEFPMGPCSQCNNHQSYLYDTFRSHKLHSCQAQNTMVHSCLAAYNYILSPSTSLCTLGNRSWSWIYFTINSPRCNF